MINWWNPQMPNLVLQQRDFAILTEIGLSPACSRAQIARHFFHGSTEAAKKRLQRLIQAGLIIRNDESALGRSVLRITKNGADVISTRSPGNWRTRPVSAHMLRHELLLADCLSSLKGSAEARNQLTEISLAEDEVTFGIDCETHSRHETVTPDAVVTLRGEQIDYLFLEIDRSTESQSHLIHLAEQYRIHHRSGSLKLMPAAEHGVRPRERVLFIMLSAERLNTTGRLLRNFTAIRTLVWLCLADDFISDPVNAKWRCPIDFNDSPITFPPRLLF